MDISEEHSYDLDSGLAEDCGFSSHFDIFWGFAFTLGSVLDRSLGGPRRFAHHIPSNLNAVNGSVG